MHRRVAQDIHLHSDLRAVHDHECGDHTFDNTASFETTDTGATGEDSWQVIVTVACPTGCTLTQGYWKTHSEYGPARRLIHLESARQRAGYDLLPER